MSEYGVVTEAGAVRFERLLPGPIERVWAYLTDPNERATWLAAGPMELRVGGPVELSFHHADLSAEKTPPERYKKLEGGHTIQGRITCNNMCANFGFRALRSGYLRGRRKVLHLISSSARTSSRDGISRPIALAVLRLIVRSNLVGC